MEQRRLGRSGLLVSVVGLGCNNFGGRIDFEATKKVVHKALDLGITFFDEADTYGDPRGSSEACLGQILGDRRKDIVLATKFWSKSALKALLSWKFAQSYQTPITALR